MGIFAKAASKAFDQGVGTLAAGRHIAMINGGRSITGLAVTTDKAMRYSAFWSAVRILSESVATLPVNVMEELPNGDRRVADDHPVQRVIHWQANPQMDAYHLFEHGMTHITTWGNHFAMIARDGRKNVRELWPLQSDRMEEVRRDETGELVYTYHRANGQLKELTQAEVFHVPGLGWDGVQGYSVIRNARESIGLGLAAEEHGARFFGNGATAGFMLSTDKKLSETSIKNLEKQLKEEKAGLQSAWEPWVLEEGLKPVPITIPNDDAQWLETRKHQVTEIARWFRLPPHMLADLERATFSNIEHLGLEFVKYSLLSWLRRYEVAIGSQLLGPDWKGNGGRFYIKFNVNALERGDLKTRFEAYAIGRQWGFMNGSQIAELEDWDKWEGSDDYLIPQNMTSVGPDGTITQTTLVAASRNGKEPTGATA